MTKAKMRAVWCWRALASGVIVAAGGCSTPGSSPKESPEVAVLTAGATLHDPVWSYRDSALVGLTGDGQIAEISDVLSGHATTRVSPPLSAGAICRSAGRTNSMCLSHSRNATQSQSSIWAPCARSMSSMPGRARLPVRRRRDAGVAGVVGGRIIGDTSGRYGFHKLPTAHIAGDPADVLDGSNRGRNIEYHICGPSGVRYFKGPSSPPDEHGSLAMDVAVSAGDGTATTRSYVARPNDDILYVVDVGAVGSRCGFGLPPGCRRRSGDSVRTKVASRRSPIRRW